MSSPSQPFGPQMLIPEQQCCAASPRSDAIVLHNHRGAGLPHGAGQGDLTRVSLADFSPQWSSTGPFDRDWLPNSLPLWASGSPKGHHLAVIWSSALFGLEGDVRSEDECRDSDTSSGGKINASDTSSENSSCQNSDSCAHRTQDHNLKYLCFHTSKDGEGVGSTELCEGLFEPGCECPGSLSIDWSPAGSQVLCSIPRAHNVLRVFIVDTNGSNMCLSPPSDCYFVAVRWSPCRPYREAKLRPRGISPTNFGLIFNASTGEQTHQWDYHIFSISEWPASIWAPQGCKMFLPRAKMMLAFEGVQGLRGQKMVQAWLGPDPPDIFSSEFVFAPSGDLMVNAWQKQDACSIILGLTHKRTIQRSAPALFHLWHPETTFKQPSCTPIAIASCSEPWDVTSIAWHPAPISSCIYAIADGLGRVHLMDGYRHASLHCWDLWECDLGLHLPYKLSWSPDGSQFALNVLNAHSVLFVLSSMQPTDLQGEDVSASQLQTG